MKMMVRRSRRPDMDNGRRKNMDRKLSPCALGYMIIRTPDSALNNMGVDKSERTDNICVVKTLFRGDGKHPFVSARAVRYWWRETLSRYYGWGLSPVEREKKIAFTQAMPEVYPDDDIFGFMRAEGKKDKGKKEVNEALTRES